MTFSKTRGGFTLIEVLVASLLLGMLVTILTMVFNQSAIAWRTGKAGVAQLGQLRHDLTRAQYNAENIVPCVDASGNQDGMVVSAWQEDGEIRHRALGRVPSGVNFSRPSFRNYESAGKARLVQPWGQVNSLDSIKLGSGKTYIVGVMSQGPNVNDEDDDITTWPENVQ